MDVWTRTRSVGLRNGGEPAAAQLLRERAPCTRVALQAERPGAVVALVVDQHAHARVRPGPGEQLMHERGIVAAPQRPLPERERLAGELAVEGLEAREVGELRVEVGADPVD